MGPTGKNGPFLRCFRALVVHGAEGGVVVVEALHTRNGSADWTVDGYNLFELFGVTVLVIPPAWECDAVLKPNARLAGLGVAVWVWACAGLHLVLSSLPFLSFAWGPVLSYDRSVAGIVELLRRILVCQPLLVRG